MNDWFQISTSIETIRCNVMYKSSGHGVTFNNSADTGMEMEDASRKRKLAGFGILSQSPYQKPPKYLRKIQWQFWLAQIYQIAHRFIAMHINERKGMPPKLTVGMI
jgi:hypothetical protein